MATLAASVFGPILTGLLGTAVLNQFGNNHAGVPYAVAEMRYVLIMGTVLGMLALFTIVRCAIIRRRHRWQAREVLTEDEWYGRFYGTSPFSREVVRSVLSAFAAELGGKVHPTQLRPDDRLEDFAVLLWGVPITASLETAECELAIALGGEFKPDPSWMSLKDVIIGACQQLSSLSDHPFHDGSAESSSASTILNG
jgi:hypothetical protein